jgi:hypothetical protein
VLDAESTFGSLGVGLANSQAAPPFSFNGNYGLYLTQSSGALENDGTGQITVDGTSNTLSGIIDTTLGLVGFSAQPDTAITGTFAAIPSSGRFTGALTNTFFPTPGATANTIAVAFYLVDSDHGYFIETDSATSDELSFGYFATRNSVCPSCEEMTSAGLRAVSWQRGRKSEGSH